jgi:UDP-N-acetylmuramoylalanine--D-glutamate ligase
MIDVFPFAGFPVAVLGLGRTGMSAARALLASGAQVMAWDDDAGAREAAGRAEVPLVDLHACDWKEMTTLVLSPGIPHAHPRPHPVARAALDAGCEVVGDVELLVRAQRDAAYVGITGTNGKSTATALIGHILLTTGRQAEVGGNLGVPALELEPLGSEGTYVLEMSSYQLELTRSITFDVAVLLNISPDHLERHGGMDGYVAAKKLIFHRQTAPRTAVIGVDDAHCRTVCGELRAGGDQVVVPVSGETLVPGGVYVVDGILYDDTEGGAVRLGQLGAVATLPGRHNWQNAAAAYAAAKHAGVQPHAIFASLQSYPGLVHRQETVAYVDGIAYVNDSKATNAAAAARALACYENVYWIAGGRAKPGGLDGIEPALGTVRHAFLMGEAADAFAAALEGDVDTTRCADLAESVARARAMALDEARPGAVVLLSPAGASFDQFADFEARGDAFRVLVEALPGVHRDPFDDEDDAGASPMEAPS